MSLLKTLASIKIKYFVGIISCLLIAILLTERRHLLLTPQWHIVKPRGSTSRLDSFFTVTTTPQSHHDIEEDPMEHVVWVSAAGGDKAVDRYLLPPRSASSSLTRGGGVLRELTPEKMIPFSDPEKMFPLDIELIHAGNLFGEELLLTVSKESFLSVYKVAKSEDADSVAYQLIWKSQIIPSLVAKANTSSWQKSKKRLKAGSILLSEMCYSPSQCGIVFVGLAYIAVSHQHSNNDATKDSESPSDEDHFSTLALQLSNGSVLWHHLPGDFLPANKSAFEFNAASATSHHWKLELLKHHQTNSHVGEKPWQAFKDDVFHLLPQRWTWLGDTSLRLFSLGKTSASASASSSSFSSNAQKKRKKRQQSDSSDNGNDGHGGEANVLVAKYHNGIDILDLLSGRPRTRLQFPGSDEARTQAALHHQGVTRVLQIALYSRLVSIGGGISLGDEDAAGPPPAPQVHCGATFTDPMSISGSDEVEWPVLDSLCAPVSYFDYPRFSQASWTEDANKTVAALVLPSYGKAGGVWGLIFHLLGGNLRNSHLNDILFLVSDGGLTSYSSAGHVNWRINSQVSWIHLSNVVKAGRHLDDSIHNIYTEIFHPSLTRMDISHNTDVIPSVLIVGWDSISLVDLVDGHLLATHDLPCHPMQPPWTRRNRVIIHCDTMLIEFFVEPTEQWFYMLILGLSFAVCFMLLSWCCDPNNPIFGDIWI